MKKMFVLLMGLMFLAACATTTPDKSRTRFLREYEKMMTPAPKGAASDMRWLKPGVDFGKYDKVMVDYVIFAISPDSEFDGIQADEMKLMADIASLALVEGLKTAYPVVSEPGPTTLRIKTAIVDLKQSNPGLSAVTTVVPVGLAISLVKKGTTGSYAGGGFTKAEAIAMDSMTNEVLAVGHADYSAAFTERFSSWGSVEEAFKKWGPLGAEQLKLMMKK